MRTYFTVAVAPTVDTESSRARTVVDHADSDESFALSNAATGDAVKVEEKDADHEGPELNLANASMRLTPCQRKTTKPGLHTEARSEKEKAKAKLRPISLPTLSLLTTNPLARVCSDVQLTQAVETERAKSTVEKGENASNVANQAIPCQCLFSHT